MRNLILFVLVAAAGVWLWFEYYATKKTTTTTGNNADKSSTDVINNPVTTKVPLVTAIADLPLKLAPTIVVQPPKVIPWGSSNYTGSVSAIATKKPHCLTMAINQPWYVIPGKTCRMHGPL